MPAPEAIRALVQKFAQNVAQYHSDIYNETTLRREFLDPFFEALGWDVDNSEQNDPVHRAVVHEDRVRINKRVQKPDYGFYIGKKRKFFLEAKPPGVNIKDGYPACYQLRIYAWNAKLPISILSDFEEFSVYDCRGKPIKDDPPIIGRLMYFTYDQYIDKWDEIASILSYENVRNGSLDRFAEVTKSKHGTEDVDDAFLKEIERWRDQLARNIALRNPQLDNRALNYAVQMTIDRIIFLRICEDRDIEPYGQLQELIDGADIYIRLCELFKKADEKYNSGLFHFRSEKGNLEKPDNWTLGLLIDDKIIKDMISRLYYPDSPYEFSVMPADILGQVYEQFLGKVIRLTPGHRAIIEEKPEVKKAGGVFYTPTYIVDYIVRQTIGKLVEGKHPGEEGVGKGTPIRVLDPACGSGSFLIGAYQFLLDWYRDGYTNLGTSKFSKGKQPIIYQGDGGEWLLTTSERKRILLDHIFGVDIDTQAVEVTKLSLLLKVLEGENEQSLARQLSFWQERALPDLGCNIKCGNSLIGWDYFEEQDEPDKQEVERVNPFNWQDGFPQVFRHGGFDVVIGNPPYVRQETLGKDKVYFQNQYKVYHGIADLYAYFVERAISLLRRGGLFGFIVANKWMRANYGEPLRRWLKNQQVIEITDFGDLPVFETATTYPCILLLSNLPQKEAVRVTQVKTLSFYSLETYVQENGYSLPADFLQDTGWSLSPAGHQFLLEKIRNAGIPLSDYVHGKIFYGIKTGLNEAFVIDADTRQRLIEEDPRSAEIIKSFLAGRDIKRYQPVPEGRYLILFPRGWTREQMKKDNNRVPFTRAWTWLQKEYSAIAEHLHPFMEKGEKRYDKGEYWWELRTCDYYDEFEKPKIIIPTIIQNGSYTFDDKNFYSNDKTSIISSTDLYLLGLLNSKVCDYFMHQISSTKQGGYYEYKPMYVSKVPIRLIDFSDSVDINCHDRLVTLVNHMLKLHKRNPQTPYDHELLMREIAVTDRAIDALVYELYGLTDEEINIVEEN